MGKDMHCARAQNCCIGTDGIPELLVYARARIPWVRANLIIFAGKGYSAIQEQALAIEELETCIS